VNDLPSNGKKQKKHFSAEEQQDEQDLEQLSGSGYHKKPKLSK